METETDQLANLLRASAVAELEDVVDHLTIEHVVTVPLDNGRNHYESHDGLIVQLRRAITPDLGRGSGGSTGEPSVMDVDAAERYARIKINIIARLDSLPTLPIAGRLPFDREHPEQSLRQWRYAFLAYADITTDDIRDAVQQLHRMAGMIRDKFDPPRQRELVGIDCPVCGQAWWLDNRDRHNIVRRTALVITIRPGDLDESFAECTHCQATRDASEPRGYWRGERGLRELQWDIEQAADQHIDIGASS
ncbi:hypothetical protein [Curtobacterium oceanosedimentum]|uniref:hypothetical protein n=1 Tax=Curtobacterium oceanosedimentum TaxID=465820 RepID=UPI003391E268